MDANTDGCKIVDGRSSLADAKNTLQRGGLIAYPTEAVWGLGCDPWNQASVNRLLTLKQRPVDKGLILVAAHLDQLGPLKHDLNEQQLALLIAETPRPTTWLVPDEKNRIPTWIKGQHQKVAIRITKHPLTANLCRLIDSMLVSTSANESGKDILNSAVEISRQLGQGIDLIVDGPLGKESQASEIKDLTTGEILR